MSGLCSAVSLCLFHLSHSWTSEGVPSYRTSCVSYRLCGLTPQRVRDGSEAESEPELEGESEEESDEAAEPEVERPVDKP